MMLKARSIKQSCNITTVYCYTCNKDSGIVRNKGYTLLLKAHGWFCLQNKYGVRCYCKECSRAAKKKQTYNSYKRNAICPLCRKNPARSGLVSCKQCAEQHRLIRKEERVLFKKTGMCQQCGKNEPLVNRRLCYECLEFPKNGRFIMIIICNNRIK